STSTTTNVTIDPLLTVSTTSGIYTGFVSPSVPEVHQWLGIRYGLPPIGSKRFLPPEPATDSNVHHYARDYKPICFQQSGSHTGLFWELVPEFQNQDPQGEDCLFLNIWAPRRQVGIGAGLKRKEEKLPVLIWVCGGGLQEGGGHAPYQVPDKWVQRMKTHIVITFNYRLNIFGFPGAKGAPENAGFHDARLVVEWAKANIAGFGGDPERMVIWGQSAGAGLVGAYLYANPSDPIISGAIAMSGSATAGGQGASNAFSKLAKAAGCGGLDASEELSCMQNIPALRLQDLVQTTSLPGTNVSTPRFGAVADNVTVFANNTERLEKGLAATVVR
ncbi:alpha/beta-hydrolase, partial [Periconia macrospinosa]